MTIPRIIAVVGGSGAGDTEISLAMKLGRAIVEQDNIVVTGGDGIGSPLAVKDAAIVGAKSHPVEQQRRTMSIVRSEQALGLKGTIVTPGFGHGRNILNAAVCDAMIALKGGEGTLSEAAFAHLLGRRVIFLNGAEIALAQLLPGEFTNIAPQCSALETVVNVKCTPEVIGALGRAALTNGLRAATVDEAVKLASAAPLVAFWPKSVVDIKPLLDRYGREIERR